MSYSQILTLRISVFSLSHSCVGRAGTATLLSVCRIEITRFSASLVPFGEGAEDADSEVEANAVSIKVSSEMSRIVMNLRDVRVRYFFK